MSDGELMRLASEAGFEVLIDDAMKKIQVKSDLDSLLLAFEFHSLEHQQVLDIETGEIIMFSEFDDEEGVMTKIEKNPERYLSIPSIESHEAYDEMVDFTDTVTDKDLQEKLWIALDGKGAFGRFKRVLDGYPQERQRWFAYKDECTRRRVQEWLDDHGIELIE